MHCEDARDALLTGLDGPLDVPQRTALDAHLSGCAECRALRDDLAHMTTQAAVWHELVPPAWNPAATPRETAPAAGWLAALQSWFAPTASALALLLALGVFWQNANPGRAAGPATASRSGQPPAADLRPVSTRATTDDGLLAATRAERQQALEALTSLIKAEMDRRSLETEQSLKYIISHQIQSQRQLEAIRNRLPADPTAPGEQL